MHQAMNQHDSAANVLQEPGSPRCSAHLGFPHLPAGHPSSHPASSHSWNKLTSVFRSRVACPHAVGSTPTAFEKMPRSGWLNILSDAAASWACCSASIHLMNWAWSATILSMYVKGSSDDLPAMFVENPHVDGEPHLQRRHHPVSVHHQLVLPVLRMPTAFLAG